MKIKLFLAALILGLALPAAADLEVVALAHEISLSNFMAPATQSGGLSFKECNSCATKTVRVTPSTRYMVDGKSVRLDQFKQAVQPLRDRDTVSVIVKHHLNSDTIVSVSVTT